MQLHLWSYRTINSSVSGHYVYVYQATDTITYPLLSQITKFPLSHSPHSHCSNTVNICTVVMLGFWLLLFNSGSLAWGVEFVIVWGLCLLLFGGSVCFCVGIVFVIVWGVCFLLSFLFHFSNLISSLGWCCWGLRLELHRAVFPIGDLYVRLWIAWFVSV